MSLSSWGRMARFQLIQPISIFFFLLSRNAYFLARTLEKMSQFQVYFEGEKRKAGCIAVGSRQYNPPVCQELACRTISFILPQNRLTIAFVSNSCKSKGVGLCLPQSYPNLLLCWKRPAHRPLVLLQACLLYLYSDDEKAFSRNESHLLTYELAYTS